MSKMREIVATVAIATALGGCQASDLFRSDEPDAGDDDDDIEDDDVADDDFPRPVRDGGSVDAGRLVSAPARLDQLIVADRPPPPISGGTLVVAADGTLAVAADPDRDAVYLVNVASASARTVSLPEQSEPGRVALDEHGYAHVVLRNRGALAHIDLGAGTMAAETQVCQLPRGLAYDRAQGALWIACASGELVSLDAETHAERSRTFVALDLRDVLVTPAGSRFVSSYRSAELIEIGADGAIGSRSAPAALKAARSNEKQASVTMSPTLAWRTVVGSDGQPWMLHQRSQIEEVVISAGGYGGGCQTITQTGVTHYGPDGKPTETTTLAGAALSVDMAVSPDGQWIAMATPGAYLRGEQGSVQVISSQLLADPSPFDLVADGGMGGVADAGLAGASAEDVGFAAPLPSFDAGVANTSDAGLPQPDPSGCNGGVAFDLETQVTAVAFDSAGRLYVLSREPGQLAIYDDAQAATSAPFPEQAGWSATIASRVISLSEDSVRDTGHELFHADVGSGLACASCHGEALDDGHVWNFQDVGPRRTQNMRGGLLSTLPLHWEGDLPTFQHLVDEVMTRRMSGFQVEAKYANALATWIDAQPAIALERADTAAIARGKALFASNDVGCATCHSSAMLTNNQTVDVGTGGAFQVPSLHGLALRAPFMHDGCAATLADRFDAACGGGDRHGKTSQLTPEQLADLVAYLETL